MREFAKSHKLDHVCYDIRGPVMDEANMMEAAGEKILKLNIGNPATFGFNAPDDVMQVMSSSLPLAQGYSDSHGIIAAREAIIRYDEYRGIKGVTPADIYTGNGVSELITMSMQGLLDSGDEVLVPSPDYPLWTASVTLAGGTAVHYVCDESADWNPDIEDLKKRTINEDELTLYDKWILTKKNQLIKNVIKNMDKYEFHNVGNELYSFIWEDFCDWYIELTKSNMTETTKTVLLDTLTDILKLLHPFMPYVTEEIYQKLPIKDAESIMISSYPTYNKKDIYKEESEELESILEDIVAVRNLKASNKITKEALVNFECKNEKLIPIYASQLKITEDNLTSDDPDNMVSCNYKSQNITITYFFEEAHVDEKALEEEINKLKSSIERREKLLSNENYVNKAPANIVELDRKKLAEEKEKLEKLLK